MFSVFDVFIHILEMEAFIYLMKNCHKKVEKNLIDYIQVMYIKQIGLNIITPKKQYSSCSSKI